MLLALLLALCPPSARIAPEWAVVRDETGAYELRLPKTLKKPEKKYFFIHGGEVWKDDHTTVSLAFGHWSASSFEEEQGERCRMPLDGASVFIIVEPKSVLAWYDRGSGNYEVVVKVTTDDEKKLPELAAIALSLREKKKEAP